MPESGSPGNSLLGWPRNPIRKYTTPNQAQKHGPDIAHIGGSACLAAMALGLLGLPRLGSASLALLAPRNNSPAAWRRGAPLLFLLVRARRARPNGGEVSRASQTYMPVRQMWVRF